MVSETLWQLRNKLACSDHLIHCITNPISINDCANVILAVGGKAIMAQHPKECVQITSMSKALSLNLGNFEDTRSIAMLHSGRYAYHHQIPITLDLVGIGCSNLRLAFAHQLIEETHPTIMKGNLSELKALAGYKTHAQGIDVGEEDKEDELISAKWIEEQAQKWNCILLCSGKVDIVSDGHKTYLLRNGHELMTRCTGTGCMLGALCSAYSSVDTSIHAVLAATAIFGVVGEKSFEDATTPGRFHMRLFDWLYDLKEEAFHNMVNIEEVVR